jgi:flagellin
MALGVLNNLSAIYAENNLNNTNSSLQTVLQQLSSGSKINSGADDAAGLSLVNGLQANSTALTQSETNATEGVGLLDVADGALSQVTNMVNRAITLATEASNGTLNPTQEAAANQEYQSILAEVNNIGQTTTYNQQQVFTGITVAIYTGDSSTVGSSIDDLSIRTLSESSVGDTGGTMAYSDGANNVFLNLSTGTQNAQATDTLNASGSTTIDVTYLVKGGSGAASTATTSIAVGAGSIDPATGNAYANTADGLISAIDNAGLGLTATFTTQAQAGVTGGGTETGIEISGGFVAGGVDPSSVSTSGTLGANGIPSTETLNIGDAFTVKVGAGTAATVTITSTTNTLSDLATAIHAADSAITATVVTNGNGTQSLALADGASGGGALSVSVTAGSGAAAPTLGNLTAGVNPLALTAGGTVQVGSGAAPNIVSVGAGAGEALNDTLSGSINISVTGGTAATFTLTSSVNTLTGLMNAINADAALGATASIVTVAGGKGLELTAGANGANTITVSQNTLEDTENEAESYQSLGTFASSSDTLAGVLTIAVGVGVPQTLTLNGTDDTLATLMSTINNDAALGVTASNGSGWKSLKLTSNTEGTAGNLALVSSIADTDAATPSYTAASAYDTGLHGDATNKVYDSSSGQTAASLATFVSDANGLGATATVSYSDSAGEALNGTDLLNQTDAESALNDLNVAIADVSAQDGYIGAQINTLNSVSQVITTQQENVVSAQNAIQATDYASATSNMSKYEILSQTGIAALAQANSVQQEVTKLLQ